MVKALCRYLHKFAGIIGIIFDVQQAFSYIGGSGMTGLSGYLWDKIPLVFPITFLIVGIGSLIYGIIRTIIKYRIWGKTEQNTVINTVMKTELDYYECLAQLIEKVVKRNRKKDVASKTKNKIAKKYYQSLGLTDEMFTRYAHMSVAPEHYTDRELKQAGRRINQLIHYNPKEHFTANFFLDGLGTILNRSGLGIKEEINNSGECVNILNRLHREQLSLEVPEDKVSLVDDLKALAYGLANLSITLKLINPNRFWYKYLPERLIDYEEKVDTDNKDRYDKAYMFLKRELRKYTMKAGLV